MTANNGKILLLGATGIVGTAVEKIAGEKRLDYLALNHSDFDITDSQGLQRLIERHRPAAVINCVVFMGIDPCEKDPARALAVNAAPVLVMAKTCQRLDAVLVQPGSHAVFDGLKDDYYAEDDAVRITGVYAASKYFAEKFAARYCRKHYIVRFPTLFGARRNNSPGFADKVITWLREGREMRIADDKIDSPTYSLDAAHALLELLENQAPYGLYHIANQGKASYYHFALKMAELLGFDARISPAKDADFPAAGFKPLKTALKSNKIPPLRRWEDALQEYLQEIEI